MSLKEQVIKQQRDQSLRSFKFNRFLLVRYGLALYFFVNVYWAIFNLFTQFWSALLPIVLVALSVWAVSEQIRLYWHHDNQLPKTSLYFKFQLVTNIGVMAVVWLESVFKFLFPFLSFNSGSLIMIYGLLVLGALGLWLMIGRIQRISNNQDKKYELILKYERTINGV